MGPVDKTKTTGVQTFPSLLFSSPQWFQNGSHIESELNKIDKHIKNSQTTNREQFNKFMQVFHGRKSLVMW